MKEIAATQAQQHAQVLNEFKSTQSQFNELFRMLKTRAPTQDPVRRRILSKRSLNMHASNLAKGAGNPPSSASGTVST